MSLTLDDLFASPDHYLHSFDGDAALFMPMDRAAYHRSIFLDGRISPAADQSMRLPVRTLTSGIAAPPAATGWIFHVAHCGSTLLARALDLPGANLVLREPLALRQVAIAPDAERLALTTAMLAKRYRPDVPTIVKANVPVNFLLPGLIKCDPSARAIFLHCSLRDYLLAILRSVNHRSWMQRVTVQLAPHIGDVSSLPDCERAAALWAAQMRAFANGIGCLANARSLDAEAFFADPQRFLALAAEHLQVPLGLGEAEAIVAGPLFATYSKNPEIPFDNDARLERRLALERSLAAEIDQAALWVERAAGDVAAHVVAIRKVSLDR